MQMTNSHHYQEIAYEYLMICPGRSIVFRVIPFNLHSLETVVPCLAAMTERLSPDFTR